MHRYFVAALLALSPMGAQAETSPAEPRHTATVAEAPAQQHQPQSAWGTQIDYDYTVERPDQLADVAGNREVSRPAFATLKRSFGSGDFRPYLGLGLGQASSQFQTVTRGAQDSFALKGVVGGKMIFTEEIGGYVQYDYAVASENPILAEDDRSHGIRFGLSISLN